MVIQSADLHRMLRETGHYLKEMYRRELTNRSWCFCREVQHLLGEAHGDDARTSTVFTTIIVHGEKGPQKPSAQRFLFKR